MAAGVPIRASMKPANATPRPKPFWRRNWLSLLALVSLLFLSAQALEAFIPPRWLVLSRQGDLAVVALDEAASAWISHGGKHGWVETHWRTPQFGRWVGIVSEDRGSGIILPIWIPLASVAAWIAFREWRRQRTANPTP
jgi:hypothetical protein